MVPVDEFFEGNHIKGSFATNACTPNFDVDEFYNTFKTLLNKDFVQDIWISIYDIEEDWAYSDTVFISTTATKKELEKFFDEAFPSDIGEVEAESEEYRHIPKLNENYKLYYL